MQSDDCFKEFIPVAGGECRGSPLQDPVRRPLQQSTWELVVSGDREQGTDVWEMKLHGGLWFLAWQLNAEGMYYQSQSQGHGFQGRFRVCSWTS